MNKLWGTLLAALACTALAQSIERHGAWTLERALDPFTDEDQSIVYVAPVEYPSLGGDDFLAIGCGDGSFAADGVSMILLSSEYISERNTEVIYRVDSNAPVTRNWFATDSSVTPQPMYMQALIAEMLTGSKLVIRYQAYRSSPTYTFEISGLREALARLACYTGEL